MVKVTFVAPNYPPSFGGAQSLVEHIAEGLASRPGNEVEVVTTDALRSPAARYAGHVGPASEIRNGVRVRRLTYGRSYHRLLRIISRARAKFLPRAKARRAGPMRAGPLGLRVFAAVVRACRRSNIVVAFSDPSFSLAILAILPRSWAVRVAVPLLHQEDGSRFSAATQRRLRRFDIVVALTNSEARMIVSFGVDPRKVRVVPPGCSKQVTMLTSREARHRLGLPDRFTVGYIGRITAYKGVDTVLEASPTLLAGRLDLGIVIAGADQGWSEFSSRVASLRSMAGDQLLVRHDLTDLERDLLLASCDVVMCPSRGESFGMVTIEAWRAGRPVVAGDIPAVRDLIRPGIDGLLVPINDPDALAEAVRSLADRPDIAHELGMAGHARATTEFDWELIIDRWAELLRP